MRARQMGSKRERRVVGSRLGLLQWFSAGLHQSVPRYPRASTSYMKQQLFLPSAMHQHAADEHWRPAVWGCGLCAHDLANVTS